MLEESVSAVASLPSESGPRLLLLLDG